MRRIEHLLVLSLLACGLVQTLSEWHGVMAEEQVQEPGEADPNYEEGDDDDDDDEEDDASPKEEIKTENKKPKNETKPPDQELKKYSDKIVELTAAPNVTEYNKWKSLGQTLMDVAPVIMKIGGEIAKLWALRKKSKSKKVKGASSNSDDNTKKDKKKKDKKGKEDKKKKKKKEKEESAELKYMKEQFEIVIDSIARVDHKLDDLENVVVHEQTKSAFGEYQRTIENLFYDWQYVINTEDEVAREQYKEMFVDQYYRHYKHAALHLFNAMTSTGDGELNNDLLGLAKQRYKCDGVRIRKLCAVITQTIMHGIAVEGAYYAYENILDRAANEERVWRERMSKLSNVCEGIIKECQAQWKSYVNPVLWDTYNKFKDASNEQLATEVHNKLSKTLRQRLWFVFVYDSMTGFDNHGYGSVNTSLFNDVETKWRENGKMFSVVSIDQDDYPTFEELPQLQEDMQKLAGRIAKCDGSVITSPNEPMGKALFSYMKKMYKGRAFVTYAVKRNSNLAFKGPENRFAHVVITPRSACPLYVDYFANLFVIG